MGLFFAGNGQYDGALEYEGHDWGYGWNIGALWQVDPTLRLGAAYRSSINHTLSGKVEWSIPNLTPAMAAGLTAKGYATSTGRVNVKTPDSFSLNFYKELHPQLALMGDWTHTRHSKFQELRLEIITSLGGLPDQVPALTKLLMLNYSETPYPICFASDVEGNELLAIIRLPVDSNYETLLAALQSLMLQIEANKAELEATFVTKDIMEKFKIAS